jgi:4,5:9,10-diseco-3-hydroxy-5,9,17-trioxoandrosta-1(10),2-diene-4-oate hydrolase
MPESLYERTSVLTTVGGTTFHANEAGDGPVLIALHGGGPGANAWDNTAASFEAFAERFRVILLDLPGFGGSVRGADFAAEDGQSEDRVYARALLAYMDERGIGRAHFLGASMSGGCVLRLAIDHPERVGKLVLKGPGGMSNPFSPGPPPGIMAMLEFMKDPTREQMAKVMHLFVPNGTKFREDMVDRRFEAAMRTPSPPHVGPVVSLESELSKVTAPTLVLWGRDDQMVPFAGFLPMLHNMPDVRLHAWGAGTGHFVEWEHPAEFARVVAGFLED